jgi:hypothetical protein
MAKVLGTDLCPFVRDVHTDEWALHSYVLHPQAGALQRERGSGATQVLGRPRVQIYTFRELFIDVWFHSSHYIWWGGPDSGENI